MDGFVVPNLLGGCSFMNTFMASSLDCLFSQNCLDIVRSFKNSHNDINRSPFKFIIFSWHNTSNNRRSHDDRHMESNRFPIPVSTIHAIQSLVLTQWLNTKISVSWLRLLLVLSAVWIRVSIWLYREQSDSCAVEANRFTRRFDHS